MEPQELYRFIDALESAGWTSEEIINILKYIASGDEQFKPKPKEE